jgi:hypothetical protein
VVRRRFAFGAVATVAAIASCNDLLGIPGTVNEACTADATCSVATPWCELPGGVCRQCLLDSHCPTGVCLPGGSCAHDTEIVYATAIPPATADCNTPATACDLPAALTRVTASRFVVVLDHAGAYNVNDTIAVTRRLVLFGKDRVVGFAATQAMPLFDVHDGGDLTVVGITIPGATGTVIQCKSAKVDFEQTTISTAASIANLTDCSTRLFATVTTMFTGTAITSTGGSLTIDRTTIRHADGGAIHATSATISNSVIRLNGGSAAEYAVSLDAGEIVHTMIAANTASMGFGHGLVCGTSTINSSIVFQNLGVAQLANDCVHVTYTLSDSTIPGVGNQVGDPQYDLNSPDHVLPTSPCSGAGDPKLAPDRDIDGELRPIPLDSVNDCGADEIP